jgi:lipopolysaccharide/colanic/teichoic acid biosynthesis glycosyltransferase
MLLVAADPVALQSTMPAGADGARLSDWSVAGAQADAPALSAVAHAFGSALRREALYSFSKRALDLVIAVLLLIALAPVFAVIAIAIRLDGPGSILYRGERVGRYGSRFSIVKFRSMRVDADPTAHRAFLRSLMQQSTTCTVYKVPDDPRVTRVGAILRKTSLDELPQLWNVLRGEMSLVGPRPDVPYALAEYSDVMHRRLLVKPGITGLWQVSGRSRLSPIDMYRLDVAYVGAASLAFDLRILLRTVPVVLTRDGAA